MRNVLWIVFALGSQPLVAAPTDVVTSGIDGLRFWRADGKGSFAPSESPVSALRHHAAVAAGDLDGDGCEDLFAVRFEREAPHTVLFGRGDRHFVASKQVFGGKAPSWGARLGDLDGDGDLDAYVSTAMGESCPADEVWLNDGRGGFLPGEDVGAECSSAAALVDVDRDGDLDVIAANTALGEGRPDAPGWARVWSNDGAARFSTRGRGFGPFVAHDVAAADLDGDGDEDAVLAAVPALRVLRNEGQGRFEVLPQEIGDGRWFGVAASDLDGDGDIDLAAANAGRQGGRVFLNNGDATFQDSGQSLGQRNSLDVELLDVDGDGDADALFANRTPEEEWPAADAAGGANEIWLNDGKSRFERAKSGLGSGLTREITPIRRAAPRRGD